MQRGRTAAESVIESIGTSKYEMTSHSSLRQQAGLARHLTDDSVLESPISAYEWNRNHKAPGKASTVKELMGQLAIPKVVTVRSARPGPFMP